jgi:hypothetical protein
MDGVKTILRDCFGQSKNYYLRMARAGGGEEFRWFICLFHCNMNYNTEIFKIINMFEYNKFLLSLST